MSLVDKNKNWMLCYFWSSHW